MSERQSWNEKLKRLSSTFKFSEHIEHAKRNSSFWSRKSSFWSTKDDGERRKSARPELSASHITTRQSMRPLILLCVVFVILGFTGGIFEVLNKRFQEALGISKTESAATLGAFFGSYLIGPLTYSGWLLRRFGYRWTFIVGLCIYAAGVFLMAPMVMLSNPKAALGGACASSFIVGSGLSTLDVAALPYVSICGPVKWQEFRLNLTTAIQSLATLSASVVASYVIFSSHTKLLGTVRWISIAIASTVLLIALCFYFLPIPEISDTEDQTSQPASIAPSQRKPLKRQYMLWYGALTIALYAGSQVAVGAFFINYVVEVDRTLSSASGARHLAIAHGIFTVGKFAAVALMRFVKPRLLLLAAVTLNIVFLAAVVGTKGKAGIAMISMEFFFKSCIGPTIFSIALRGLGPQTKRGASILVASMAGGGLQAPIMGAIADRVSTRIGMTVPLAAMVLVWTFPLYLNLCKAEELDAYWNSEVGLKKKAKNNADVDECEGTAFRNPFRLEKKTKNKKKKKKKKGQSEEEEEEEVEMPEEEEEGEEDVEANTSPLMASPLENTGVERVDGIQDIA